MSYKYYGRTVFETEIDGKKYSFTCFGQDTSYGFRHVCFEGNNIYYPEHAKRYLLNKCCYYNRTWECFQYQTVLRGAIEKLNIDKQIKEDLKTVLIDRKELEIHEECEKWTKDFEDTWNSLSEENKQHVKNGLGDNLLQTEEQAKAVLGIMKFMNVMDLLQDNKGE